MPQIGEPGTPAPIPGGEKPRDESLGEAEYRWGGWLLTALRIVSPKYHGQRYEDAAALLMGPILDRWPALRKWKAAKP